MSALVRQWFLVATAHLGWSPQTFWQSSVAEFFMAVEARMRTVDTGMSRAEFEELEAKYL